MSQATSRHNPRLREATRLIASSRDRRKAGRCVLEGDHLLEVYLARVGTPEFVVVVDELRDREPLAPLLARIPEADVVAVPAPLFAEALGLPVALGIVAVIPTPAPASVAPARLHLLLDDLQDPGNVGTLLRTAAAAGVDQVLLSKHCAFAWSPKVLRAGQGAHFLTTILEDVDLPQWAANFRTTGGQVAAAVPRGGDDLYTMQFAWPLAIAIGNEGSGLSNALLAECNARVRIPMPGATESLNASAAAAIVLFEALRQSRP
ncbi:MAG: RNA methyltransferase [Casimicrobiaceae bacterium]